MLRPPEPRWLSWTLFAACAGAAVGFFLAALADSWVRLAAGALSRATLFHVLAELTWGLLASWGAAAMRTRALAPRATRVRPGDQVLVIGHPRSAG